MSILLPLQERTSEQWSVDSPTRWEISAVTKRKHHRRPKTLQFSDAFPACDRILLQRHFFFFLPGPTAEKRVHPHSGQVER